MFSLWGSKAPKDAEPSSAAAQSIPVPSPAQQQAPPAQTTEIPPPRERAPAFSPRSMKQLGLFFAGAGFFTFSMLVTRRSVARKVTASLPKFYQPSHKAPSRGAKDPKDSLIAFEALNLATLNVLSFAMMATGGAAWAFDISSVEDLRAMARSKIGLAAGEIDEEAEREVEEFVSKLLKKKKPAEGATTESKRDN